MDLKIIQTKRNTLETRRAKLVKDRQQAAGILTQLETAIIAIDGALEVLDDLVQTETMASNATNNDAAAAAPSEMAIAAVGDGAHA